VAKSGNIHIGIVDFFAVFLPGAIATALLFNTDVEFEHVFTLPENLAGQWFAFLLAAYFIGHIIFVLGAFLDAGFENIRKWRLEQGARTAVENDELFFAVQVLKVKLFADNSFAVPKNNYQWAKTLLVQECPNSIIEVNRLEADSKFFRSLSVISFMAIFYVGMNTNEIMGVALIAITGICFMRYYERRLKSTSLAYLHVITLSQLNKL